MKKLMFVALPMALVCAACGNSEGSKFAPLDVASASPTVAPLAAPMGAMDFSVEEKTRLAFDALVSSGKVVPQKRVNGSKEFTKPLAFIDAPFGPVLVVGTGVVDGSHADASQIKVFYMRYDGEDIKPDKGYGEFWGLSFGEIPKLTFPTQFSSLPTIRYDSSYAQSGCSTQDANIIVLTPGKPTGSVINLESNYASVDEEQNPSFSYSGKIMNIVPDKGFDVSYQGTQQFIEHYAYRNGKFSFVGNESFVEVCN